MPYADIEHRRAYDRARKQVWYDGLSGVEYSELLLKRRRTQALSRLRDRNNKED